MRAELRAELRTWSSEVYSSPILPASDGALRRSVENQLRAEMRQRGERCGRGGVEAREWRRVT